MPAAVQTKSRANRIKLFKKYYRHHGPAFRCYHGSRLPPRAYASWEKMFPQHSKFLSSGIKWGRPIKEAKKVPKLLSKKLKAEPKKRKKRGALRRTETGKKKIVVKTVKPNKHVSFAKKGAVYRRREQKEQLYDPDVRYAGAEAQARPFTRAQMVGSRGDPRRSTFQLDAQGRLITVARRPRKLIYG